MSRNNGHAKQNNQKYLEGESQTETDDAPFALIDYFSPPKTLPKGKRRRNAGKRTANARRRQLVITLIDDSASMKHDGKAVAATEACREMIFQMRLRSVGESYFDVAILPFGDSVLIDDATFCVPVLDVDADKILFRGRSGGTKIKSALLFIEELLETYETRYLQFHDELEVHPVPLIFLPSDGYNGDGDPIPVANRIKSMQLSCGASPLIVTVGIEFGGDEPDIALLQNIASAGEQSGRPLYYDISELAQLSELLATVGSSGASTAEEIIATAALINPRWK